MITQLSIRNFQSLKHADLDLGTFTVIVGPSSSGKSALIRAVRALAQNVRGSSSITRGQKVMAITARTENHTVTLERDQRGGVYRLTGDGEHTFTKLGGDVPPQIAAALRIDPGKDSVNFASQFDRPYLLDESGSQVARELGELTNVTRIFEAVARANRTRAAAASKLKSRQVDLDLLKTRLADFTGLSDQLSLLDEVEKLDAARRELVIKAERLTSRINAVKDAADRLAVAAPAPVPDAKHLWQAYNRYRDLKAKLAQVGSSRIRLDNTIAEKYRCADALSQATIALADALREAKVCPTCGQETT